MRPARPDDFRLPDLRFVPVQSLVPHEQSDQQRLAPLVEGFRDQTVLKNPPIVTPLAAEGSGAQRYMVVDGANRCTAARSAGFPHMVVQVVHYEEPWVHLTTWHHALSQVEAAGFAEACRSIPGLSCQDEGILHARAQLARREVLAYAAHEGHAAFVLQGGRTLEERNRLLNAIVNLYQEKSRFYRVSTESFEVAKERHPDVATLMVFPHFDPAEVLELAGNGAKLPAGITRHLIRWRALRVNVPLETLTDTRHTLEQKNQWLHQQMTEKFHRREVRFYEEPTVLFDE